MNGDKKVPDSFAVEKLIVYRKQRNYGKYRKKVTPEQWANYHRLAEQGKLY